MTAPLGAVVVVRLDPAAVDVVSGLLWEWGVLGIEERDAPGGLVELRAGFDPGTDPAPVAAAVGAALADASAVTVESVTDDAWLDAWQAHATAVEVGDRLLVVPTWVPAVVPAGRVVLELPPHRAFGTGAHPTTRLALEAIERHVGPGTTVLDVGCGSGLLAVAAARLGAASVVAVDVDPEAVRATRDTAARNGVGSRVDVSAEAVADLPGTADLVVANIVLPVLLDLLPAMVARLADGGRIVLTGVLTSQVDALADAAASAGVTRAPTVRSLDGWSLLEAS